MSERKEGAGLPLPHSLQKCSKVLPMQSLYITCSTKDKIYSEIIIRICSGRL